MINPEPGTEPSATRPEPANCVVAGSALAEWVAGRRRFARLGLAAALGALGAFAMAPCHIVPLLLISFTGLVWQIDGAQRAKRNWLSVAGTGWAFATGFFAVGLYWVGNAFLVDAATFGSLMGVAVASLAAGLALFPAVTLALAAVFWRSGPHRIILVALGWSASEWLRGHLLTGFPWNLIGYTWGASLPMLQITALIGSYGLSLLTTLAAASPAALIDCGRAGDAKLLRSAIAWPAVTAAAFGFIAIFGVARLQSKEPPDVPGVKLRLIQPSVPQREKITSGNAARIFNEHIALMRRPGSATITHFVWPEAAVPILLSEDPGALGTIAQVLGPNQWLLAGSARYEPATASHPERYFNSLHIISTDGVVVATYDKHHLVPFGEYLPLKPVLRLIGLRQLVANEVGFTPGPRLRTLAVPGAPPVGPLICYEAIFPGEVVQPEHRPAWLLNITDDTWFGLGAGPRQHFESARIRAIEEGLPLIRAANNGISAAIDAKGRIRQKLALNAIGVLDTSLPPAEAPTLYARIGDLAYLGVVFALLILWFVTRFGGFPPKLHTPFISPIG